jgi:DNA-binding transcriptional LysR family regulator
MAQPAITRYLRNIERECGTLLFERTPRGMLPTPVGRAVLPRVRAIAAELVAIEHDVHIAGAAAAGHLTIGMTAAVSSLVPRAVARLRGRLPGLQVVIREDLNRALVPLLRSGEIDVLLAPMVSEELSEGLVQRVLFHNRLSVVVRWTHPLARKRSVSASKLQSCSWVLPPRTVPARLQLEIAFHQVKIASATELCRVRLSESHA